MRNYIFRLLLCVLFFSNNIFAQYYGKNQINCLLTIVDNYGDNIPNEAVFLSLEASKYSKKINYAEGYLRGYILASRGCYELGRYQEALNYAMEAEKNLKNSKYNKYVIEVIRLKAFSYTALEFYDKGRKELNRGLTIAKTVFKDGEEYRSLGLIYSDIAINLKKSRKSQDSIIYFFRRSYEAFQKMNEDTLDKESRLSLVSINLGSNFIALKQKDSAEYYLNKALNLTTEKYFNSQDIEVLFDLGRLFYENMEYDKSIFYLNDAIAKSKKINKPYLLKEIYRNLSKTYDAKRSDLKAKEYLIKYVLLDDSLAEIEKEEARKFSLQKEKQLERRENNINQHQIIIFLILLIITVVIGFIFFVKYKKEEMRRKIKTILLREKQEQLMNVVNKDNKKDVKTTSVFLEEVIQLAVNNEPYFFIKFKELYSEFCEEIVRLCPSFGVNDLKFCAMLKLDFTTKEIAQYLNISVRAVESKKYRIRKKLNISSEEDLNIWMMNINSNK